MLYDLAANFFSLLSSFPAPYILHLGAEIHNFFSLYTTQSHFQLTYMSWGLITCIAQDWPYISNLMAKKIWFIFPPNKRSRCRWLRVRISVLEITKGQCSSSIPIPLHLVQDFTSHGLRMATVLPDTECAFQTGRNFLKKWKQRLWLAESVSFYEKHNLFSGSSTWEASVHIFIGWTSSQGTWKIE